MEARPPSSESLPQPGSRRFSLRSWTGRWLRCWVPAFVSTQLKTSPFTPSLMTSPVLDGETAPCDVDETSAAKTPLPSSIATPPGASAAFMPPTVHQDRHEINEGQRFMSSTKTTSAAASVNTAASFKTATMLAADASTIRFPSNVSAITSSSSANMTDDAHGFWRSSTNTSVQPSSASAASTPRRLTPSIVPLPEEVHAVKLWATMETTAAPNIFRNTPPFSLPASTSAADALAADEMRTSPACVELPGPQSLFIRSAAASGCDRRSIGLLQRQVLAEQLSVPPSQS
ncbi:hypothetical protein ABL78_2762 [Leptomonas seymouri]|uniref:Uncharacterized protein n=1 Tax=Leptomonas seymouri TaxID=5684 RepID=A0A0N0P6X8_LEPSE|nr:hypothetical protein ABL78_2762 [Leptomonas seymouri]|eukprot:KPI88129.1 hypothetical protein ABL78_2762 [Leptomonas seymouri]